MVPRSVTVVAIVLLSVTASPSARAHGEACVATGTLNVVPGTSLTITGTSGTCSGGCSGTLSITGGVGLATGFG